jgi:hypothetical protein
MNRASVTSSLSTRAGLSLPPLRSWKQVELLAAIDAIEAACHHHNVPLAAAAAIQFSTRDLRIASTVTDALWGDLEVIAARIDPSTLPA